MVKDVLKDFFNDKLYKSDGLADLDRLQGNLDTRRGYVIQRIRSGVTPSYIRRKQKADFFSCHILANPKRVILMNEAEQSPANGSRRLWLRYGQTAADNQCALSTHPCRSCPMPRKA